MATYNPPQFPRRPKQSTLLGELTYHCQLAYYRYQLHTALYVMSPGEKLAFNLSFLSILVLLYCAVYYYLPSAIHVSIQRLAYYFTGSKLTVTGIAHAVASPEMLQTGRHSLATLADGTAAAALEPANASSMFAS